MTTSYSLPRGAQSLGHSPAVTLFCLAKQYSYFFFLLHPKLCLCVSIRHQWTEAELWQQQGYPDLPGRWRQPSVNLKRERTQRKSPRLWLTLQWTAAKSARDHSPDNQIFSPLLFLLQGLNSILNLLIQPSLASLDTNTAPLGTETDKLKRSVTFSLTIHRPWRKEDGTETHRHWADHLECSRWSPTSVPGEEIPCLLSLVIPAIKAKSVRLILPLCSFATSVTGLGEISPGGVRHFFCLPPAWEGLRPQGDFKSQKPWSLSLDLGFLW